MAAGFLLLNGVLSCPQLLPPLSDVLDEAAVDDPAYVEPCLVSANVDCDDLVAHDHGAAALSWEGSDGVADLALRRVNQHDLVLPS